MTIRTANNRTPGVRFFYVSSESKPGKEYSVQHVRRAGQRRFFCSCPDFQFRRVAKKRHCKHCRAVARLARLAGGVSKLPAAISNFTAQPAQDAGQAAAD